MKKSICLLFYFSVSFMLLKAQPSANKVIFTHQDTLRGSNGPERSWWNVLRYDINITPDYKNKTLTGKTTIEYKVIAEQHSDYMQIDLQQPLRIDELYYNNKLYINYPPKPYYREGNVWHIPLPKAPLNSVNKITVVYSGVPREAKQPPWDGGWIWAKDQGRPWMAAVCQGLGSSVWYPCKDYQGDEPDNGATLTINVADTLTGVGNGRLAAKKTSNGMTSYTWEVKNPINNYNIAPYIGKYVSWTDTLMGEKGKLDLGYWVLDHDENKARQQFDQVKLMLRAFEYWMGPYPFYEDGYKLVEAPYLGEENQSAIAYGNRFANGYLGNDRSGTGYALKFDYIIIHESGHEWFGNNITTKDIADMWVHEGFTEYSEVLYIDYYYGNEAGNKYIIGNRINIQNDEPIIGPYGVNHEGTQDMYDKGANMIHTIRQLINNDDKFRHILRGLNSTFYHQTVTSKQVENYISSESGIDLSSVFDQYLRHTQIPVLEWKVEGANISYRWSNCIPSFNMFIKLKDGTWLFPTTAWKQIKKDPSQMQADNNFYIKVRQDQ